MMKPALLLLLLALSQFGFGQDKTADYTIYSCLSKNISEEQKQAIQLRNT